MTLYSITDFDEGPHWGIAFIDAHTSEAAVSLLHSKLDDEDYRGDHGVWRPKPTSTWSVSEVQAPLLFVLGAGCRE